MNIKKLVGEIANQNAQYGKVANDLMMSGGLVAHAGVTIDIEVKESAQGNKRLSTTDFRLVYNQEKFDKLPEDLQREFVQKAFDQLIRTASTEGKPTFRVAQCEMDQLEGVLNQLDNEGYEVDLRSVYTIHKDAKTYWQVVAKRR